MIRRNAYSILALVASVLAVIPTLVNAAGLPAKVVSCTGVNCSVCDIATTAQNVLNTGIFVMVFLSAVLFAYAGWKMLTAGGQTESYAQGKQIFGNVVLGLVIILAGWLVIDTLMRTMLGSGFGPWNAIC